MRQRGTTTKGGRHVEECLCLPYSRRGCGEEADEADREPLTATEMEMLAADFEAVAAGQVAAWNAGDVTAVRQVDTEDIEHHDGHWRWSVSIRSQAWPSGCSSDTRIGTVAWTLCTSVATTATLAQPPGQPKAEAALLANYATAWSSNDTAAVAALYAAEATRSDPLFGHMSEGRNDVESYATEWFDWYPDVSIELVQPIAEASHDEPITGAIFAVRPDGDEGSCEVRMAVLLQTNDAEQIVGERSYYDLDSLIDCGWASDRGSGRSSALQPDSRPSPAVGGVPGRRTRLGTHMVVTIPHSVSSDAWQNASSSSVATQPAWRPSPRSARERLTPRSSPSRRARGPATPPAGFPSSSAVRSRAASNNWWPDPPSNIARRASTCGPGTRRPRSTPRHAPSRCTIWTATSDSPSSSTSC